MVEEYRTKCCQAEPYENEDTYFCGKCNRDVTTEFHLYYYEEEEERLVN